MTGNGEKGERIIHTENLVKRFGDFTAVDRLNIDIRKGEVFGLLGPNGAGKTTSIRMMVGLLKATEGKVFIDGQKVDARSDVIRSKVGVVPQDVVIWPLLTCTENLMMMANLYGVDSAVGKPRASELLKSLQLDDKASVLARDLSGGMKRRLNLALALMHDPEIVVLDEPSPGLDPQTRLLLWDFISEIPRKGEKTVILTTHFMEEADRLSSRVAIMDKGKLLVMDKPEAVKNSIGSGDNVEFSTVDEVVDEVLETIRGFEDVSEAGRLGRILKVSSHKGAAIIPRIVHALDDGGCTITDVSVKAATLEDVFIHLTGRSLREESILDGGGSQ